MKKNYNKPELEIEEIIVNDIICTSQSEDGAIGNPANDVWNFGQN